MTESKGSSTKVLFDSLTKLYKQGQLLLMDADRLMGERGWEPTSTTAPAEFSNSLSLPERWYARWAARFYIPIASGDEEGVIDRVLFVSIHFTSDQDTDVDEPVVSAGRLIYSEPMTVEIVRKSYYYWMCKYWFYGDAHKTLKGWHHTGQSRWFNNLKATETFVVPLYDITSSEKLKELVIDPLLAVQEQEEQIT